MRTQLASLPPLRVTKLPSRAGGCPDVLSGALYRKTDQLLETLLQMSANVKVVDVTGKLPGMLTYYAHECSSRPTSSEGTSNNVVDFRPNWLWPLMVVLSRTAKQPPMLILLASDRFHRTWQKKLVEI